MITRFNLYPPCAQPILNAVVRGVGGPADAEGLRRACVRHERGREDVGLPMPGPGYIISLPHYCAESDGAELWVPLEGLRWEVAP